MDTISPETIHLAYEKQTTGRKAVMESQAWRRLFNWDQNLEGRLWSHQNTHPINNGWSPLVPGSNGWNPLVPGRHVQVLLPRTLSTTLLLSLDTQWKSPGGNGAVGSLAFCFPWLIIPGPELGCPWVFHNGLCKQVKEDTESWAEGLGELSPAEKLKHLQ